jgi:glycosyltransferase involved in cell wall biosynthesis
MNIPFWNALAYYGILASEKIARAGHDVTVAGEAWMPPLKKAREANLKVIDDLELNTNNPFKFLMSVFRLRRLFDSEGYDIVCSFRSEAQNAAGLARLGLAKQPKTVRVRGDFRPVKNYFLNRLAYRKLTDGHIIPAEFMRKAHLGGLGLDHGRIRTIPAGFDIQAAGAPTGEKARAEMGAANKTVIGVVGRLDPVKGHRHFIEAIPEVMKGAGGNALFLIVGHDQEYRAADLQAWATQAGVGAELRLTGYVDDIFEYISALDIGVIPSVGSEMIMRVALEMMAMGKPVVATSVGGLPETIIHGKTGIIVPPGDAGALAGAITRLVQNPDEARRMGAAGKARLGEMYGADRFASEIMKFYGGLMEEK